MTKKTSSARKPATKKPVAEAAAMERTPVKAKKAAKPRKAATPKVATDTRLITMHGDTKLTHHGDGQEALTALIPLIDTVNASGKLLVTSAAYGQGTTNLCLVPVGPSQSYNDNSWLILTIGANGLAAFDHVPIGLATPDLVQEAALSVLDAIRPAEGEAASSSGRRADWFEQAVLAAEAVAERFAMASGLAGEQGSRTLSAAATHTEDQRAWQ